MEDLDLNQYQLYGHYSTGVLFYLPNSLLEDIPIEELFTKLSTSLVEAEIVDIDGKA